MRRRKTLTARKRRIAKTSVSPCVPFDTIPFLTSTSSYLIGRENDKKWCQCRIFIVPFPLMFRYVPALEETASGTTSNWMHPSCKCQFYFTLFFQGSYYHWYGQAIFDSCHSCSLLGGFWIRLRPQLTISSFRSQALSLQQGLCPMA